MTGDTDPTVVFCDLDGTLILDNSFHLFFAAIWRCGGWRARAALAVCLAPRAFGRFGGGHAGMKRRVLRWFATQPTDWQEEVIAHTIARMKPTLSGPIMREVTAWRDQGAFLVLATAAPDTYATRVARLIGADACLSTHGAVTPDWKELLAETKAEACRDWLATHLPGRAVNVVVLTDHSDDLPLLAMAHEAVIQAPRPAFQQISDALGAGGPVLRHVDTVAEQPDGGLWLWFDDRPEGPLDEYEVKTILSKHRYAMLYASSGTWRPVGPGQPLSPVARRSDCPSPPSSKQRLRVHLRRYLLRDCFGIYH